MGIAGKHEYRFNFLRSEEWKTIKAELLARENGKCQICGVKSIFNDGHHIFYPQSFWETKVQHLVLLCRECHDLIHGLPLYDVRSVEEAIEQFDLTSIVISEWLAQKIDNALIEASYRKHKQGACFACRTKSETVTKRELFPEQPNENSQWPFCDSCWKDMQGKYRTFAGARQMAKIIGEKKTK